MSLDETYPNKHRGIRLNSPRNKASNWVQYEFSMKLILKSKRLFYLINNTVKLENGLPVSAEIRVNDENTCGALIIDSVHEDNIDLLVECTSAYEMWTALSGAHHHISAGSRYYLLRSIMNLKASDDDDIVDHLMNINRLGSRLRKLCKDGKISIEDIEVASLTSSLPQSYSGVTSRYESLDTVTFKMISDAVREEVLNRKNRNTTASISSTAHIARRHYQTSLTSSSNPMSFTRHRTQDQRSRPSSTTQQIATSQPTCTHCGSFRHRAETCLSKKLANQNNRIDELVKQLAKPGKAKKATEEVTAVDTGSDLSDFSDAQACSAVGLSVTSRQATRFNFDSGSSNTLVPTSWPTSNAKPSTLVLRTAEDRRLKAKIKGSIALSHLGIDLIEAHTVPNLAEPLLSVADVTDKGKGVLFLKSSFLVVDRPDEAEKMIRDGGLAVYEGQQENRSYYVEANTGASFRTNPSPSASMLTWHHRLSHLNLCSLQDLRRRGEITVSHDDSALVMQCEDCIHGKFSRLNMKSRYMYKASKPLDLVHSDLCSLPVVSRCGSKYFITFIDEATHFAVVYFLKSKDQAFKSFKHYVAYAERKTGLEVRRLRSDNGGEYTS